MPKFTEGPWTISHKFIVGKREMYVLGNKQETSVIAHISIPVPNPNARLISSGPTLYDLLSEILSYDDVCEVMGEELTTRAEKLLAEIDGE